MVLTDVYVPALDQVYDFWLDESCYVTAAAKEVRSMVWQREQISPLMEEEPPVLFDAATQTMLQPDMTLEECGMKDGHRLILV